MSEDVISRFERETGEYWTTPEDSPMIIAGLLGMMSREMRKYPPAYQSQDDVISGLMILHMNTPEYRNEQESRLMIAKMLNSGVSPDDLKELWGR